MARKRASGSDEASTLIYWWNPHDEELRLRGRLKGADGAQVAKALDLLSDEQPRLPDGSFEILERRAAQALVELSGQMLADEADSPRATVVVHVEAQSLTSNAGAGEIDGAVFMRQLRHRDGGSRVVAENGSYMLITSLPGQREGRPISTI